MTPKEQSDTEEARRIIEEAKLDAKVLIDSTKLEAKQTLEEASRKALDVVAVAEKARRDILAISPNGGENANVMKELSEIKTGLAVNTTRTQNIEVSIAKIEGHIETIKNDFVPYRIFDAEKKRIESSMVNIDQLVAVKADILALTDNQKWVVRSIIGIIIAAIMGLAFTTK